MTLTLTRTRAAVSDDEDDLLTEAYKLSVRASMPAARGFRPLAPTPTTRRRTAAELSESIGATGDTISGVLAHDALSATDVPAVDAATALWLWTLRGLSAGVVDRFPVAPRPALPITESDHARLARELRAMTGLSSKTLAMAAGVSREQFQRWLAGRPISDTRHGQLIYLHSIAADAARRLGDNARLWWKTPGEAGQTPADLLVKRLGDAVHRLIARLPDPQPIVNGVMVALPAQLLDDEPMTEGDASAAWSPYAESRA